MQYALPPPPHYALCTLAEGLEVASGKPCCRSFAELSAKTAEGNRCWQGSCAPIGGDQPELKFQPKPCRDARGTPHAKDRARTCMGSVFDGAGDLLANHRTHRAANELEIHDRNGDLPAADFAGAADDGVFE